MLKTTKKLVEEMKELETQMMKWFAENIGLEMFEKMESKEFALIVKSFKLLHTSTDLMLEQAKVMDEMNAKLDKLLVKD